MFNEDPSNPSLPAKSEGVHSMIEKASKVIKDRAKKKKEEEKANENNSQGLTLDGKPEKFPFKSIKPKKAFLLDGSPEGSEDEADKGADDGTVMMQSPEPQK